jgi:hypothetical protein
VGYGFLSIPVNYGKQAFGTASEVSNLQIRFPCFQDGNRWILTHGFIKPGAQKKKGAWPEKEVVRPNETMSEYFQRKKTGQ